MRLLNWLLRTEVNPVLADAALAVMLALVIFFCLGLACAGAWS